MYPFIWSKGGGSQERMIVVEFMKLTEKLVGGALGAVEVDFTHNTYHYTTWEIKLNPSIRKKQFYPFPKQQYPCHMKFSTIVNIYIKDEMWHSLSPKCQFLYMLAFS